MTEPGLSTEIDLRIFVVGVPRSGTTLVQSLLAAHSRLTSFTESHFFSRHFRQLPLLGWPGLPQYLVTRNLASRLCEFLAENHEEAPAAAEWFEAAGSSLLGPFLSRSAARQLLRLLDELTLRRGRTGWIEKTPRHLQSIPLIEAAAGPKNGLHFIHMIRDGLEAVASLHRASQNWQRPYDVAACVRRWNSDLRLSLDRLEAPTDHFVFYEELTAEPEKTLRRLLDDLGLGWESDIFDRYGRASDQLVTREETWKAEVGRGIRPSGTSAQVLTADEVTWVNRSLHQDLYRQLAEGAQSERGERGE